MVQPVRLRKDSISTVSMCKGEFRYILARLISALARVYWTTAPPIHYGLPIQKYLMTSEPPHTEELDDILPVYGTIRQYRGFVMLIAKQEIIPCRFSIKWLQCDGCMCFLFPGFFPLFSPGDSVCKIIPLLWWQPSFTALYLGGSRVVTLGHHCRTPYPLLMGQMFSCSQRELKTKPTDIVYKEREHKKLSDPRLVLNHFAP